jgi:hypothetical protein
MNVDKEIVGVDIIKDFFAAEGKLNRLASVQK